MSELGEVRAEERELQGEEQARAEDQQPHRSQPAMTDDEEEQDRGDRDRACHRHVEGEGELREALEGENQRQHGSH